MSYNQLLRSLWGPPRLQDAQDAALAKVSGLKQLKTVPLGNLSRKCAYKMHHVVSERERYLDAHALAFL